MVYEKSNSGLQELQGNQRTLNARQRQVLIMIDGKRTHDDLAKYLNNLDVAQIIADLENQGYIYNPASAGSGKSHPADTPDIAMPAFTPTANAPVQENIAAIPAETTTEDAPVSAEKISVVKVILATTTKEHLGIMGRNLIEKIEAVQDQEQLNTCMSQWHMAIRESKSGKAIAAVLMELVLQALTA